VFVELLLFALLLASASALFDAVWAGGASCTLGEDAEDAEDAEAPADEAAEAEAEAAACCWLALCAAALFC
jgi:hypothetical protein